VGVQKVLNRPSPILLIPKEPPFRGGCASVVVGVASLDGARTTIARRRTQGMTRWWGKRIPEHGCKQVILAPLVDARRRPALTQVGGGRECRPPPHLERGRRLGGATRVRPQRGGGSAFRSSGAALPRRLTPPAGQLNRSGPHCLQLYASKSRVCRCALAPTWGGELNAGECFLA
jgi:hypothetical protein